MKRVFILVLIVLFLLPSCNQAKYLTKHGQYNQAVVEAVKKIRKKPDNEKAIEALRKSYPIANSKDLDRIKYLKQEGKPESWEEIHDRYILLKERQELVKTVLPINYAGGLTFEMFDYDADIIAAKKRAAEYLYVHAQVLLKSKNRFDARQAYYDLKKVKSFYENYENVDDLIPVAQKDGISHVSVRVEDKTLFKLPTLFQNQLIPDDFTGLNSDWVQYKKGSSSRHYDYMVDIEMNKIILSPKSVNQNNFTENMQIKDGWEYEYDSKGNVKKDSLGNDIKHIKYKNISCNVKEVIQRRDIHIQGRIIYKDNHSMKVLKTVPIQSDHIFESHYATANGDLNALKPETRALLDNPVIPVPADLEMIMFAGDKIKESIWQSLLANRGVLR
ncbi:MAG: hypothetical protein K9H64_01030 [Bacteroidales bacterium]|nr:hypothetical protein [Bacteroidales bacterium]MCF8454764.1 hypothetical protein [Bacteroidales bacterium]